MVCPLRLLPDARHLVRIWPVSFAATAAALTRAAVRIPSPCHPWRGVRGATRPTLRYISGGTWPAKKSHGEEVEVGIREVNERFTIRQEKGTDVPCLPAPHTHAPHGRC